MADIHVRFLKKAVSISLMLLGLTGLVDNIVVWHGFLANILEHYQSVRDFVFAIIPFEVADWFKDYLIIGGAFASSWASLLYKEDQKTVLSERERTTFWDVTKLAISNVLVWPVIVCVTPLYAITAGQFGGKASARSAAIWRVLRNLYTELIWVAAIFVGSLFVFSDVFFKMTSG